MGFLDELGKGINKVGKKTSELANVAKIKLEISNNKTTVDSKFQAIGERHYELSKNGMLLEDTIIEGLITEIDGLYEVIAELESKIMANTCKNCGAALKDDTKFCGSCGKPVEAEQPVANEKVCTKCGAVVGDEKFCNSCGTSIE